MWEEDKPILDTKNREVRLFGLAEVVARRIRAIVVAPIVAGAVAAVVAAIVGTGYIAKATFLPETAGSAQSGLVGLAAQFGVNVGGAGAGESLQFYSVLLHSRELLEAVGMHEYRFVADSASGKVLSGNLYQLFRIHDDSWQKKQLAMVNRLRDDIEIDANIQAGTITVTTNAPWAPLAEQIASSVIDFVNRFNLERRQTRAKAEREFIEQRLDEARKALTQAEDDVRQFMEDNRSYESSAALRQRVADLERRVSLRQQLYVNFSQAFEQARIEEVRNTPVISVVDGPVGSARPKRSPIIVGILTALGTGILMVAALFAWEFIQRQRVRDPVGYTQLAAALRSALRRNNEKAG